MGQLLRSPHIEVKAQQVFVCVIHIANFGITDQMSCSRSLVEHYSMGLCSSAVVWALYYD